MSNTATLVSIDGDFAEFEIDGTNRKFSFDGEFYVDGTFDFPLVSVNCITEIDGEMEPGKLSWKQISDAEDFENSCDWEKPVSVEFDGKIFDVETAPENNAQTFPAM